MRVCVRWLNICPLYFCLLALRPVIWARAAWAPSVNPFPGATSSNSVCIRHYKHTDTWSQQQGGQVSVATRPPAQGRPEPASMKGDDRKRWTPASVARPPTSKPWIFLVFKRREKCAEAGSSPPLSPSPPLPPSLSLWMQSRAEHSLVTLLWWIFQSPRFEVFIYLKMGQGFLQSDANTSVSTAERETEREEEEEEGENK